MTELFETPETLSPRLAWMREHGISVHHQKWETSGGEITHRFKAVHLPSGTVSIWECSEHDALVSLASKINLKLWNQ
jgi:hypothetical protein